jgi:hypothetical protein
MAVFTFGNRQKLDGARSDKKSGWSNLFKATIINSTAAMTMTNYHPGATTYFYGVFHVLYIFLRWPWVSAEIPRLAKISFPQRFPVTVS